MEQQFTQLYLRHDFAPAEMVEMQKRLSFQILRLRHKEAEKKAIVAQLSSEIEAIDSEIGSLADKINTGFEHRKMKCPLQFDWDNGVKNATHPDTGEIVETFDITEDDRQQKLKLENSVTVTFTKK